MVVDAVWLVAGSRPRMRTCGSSGGSRRAIYSPRKTKEVIAGKREMVVRASHGVNVEVWARENGCGLVRVWERQPGSVSCVSSRSARKLALQAMPAPQSATA